MPLCIKPTVHIIGTHTHTNTHTYITYNDGSIFCYCVNIVRIIIDLPLSGFRHWHFLVCSAV